MKKVQTDHYSWRQKTINNFVLPGDFWLRTARRLGEAWAKFPYGYDELMVHLSNKIKLLDVCVARNSNLFGRFLNWISGEEVDVIVLDGTVVRQLFEIISDEAPDAIDAGASYRFDHNDVRRWYALAADAKLPTESDSSP